MDLSNDQYAARKAIFDWYRDGGYAPFFLAGYAGTGKTTLVKHMIAEAKSPGTIAVLAPTNKAARVLREKGVTQAQTIHSFLYGEPEFGDCECGSTDKRNHDKRCPALKMDFKLRGIFSLNGEIIEEIPPTLIIVDEASMVNEKIAKDILDKGIPTIFVGDPGQLPPVEGQPVFKVPSFTLEEIQRQAAENPIIRLAHMVRHGQQLRPGSYGGSVITRDTLDRAEFDTDDWDQILVWKHVTRVKYNNRYRQLIGRNGILEKGETVLFKSTHKELGIANGDMFPVVDIIEKEDKQYMELVLDYGDGKPVKVSTWRQGFGGAQDWKDLSTMDFRFRVHHAQAMHSYAITTHSAQGSEWPRVLIAQDGSRDPKWLYTALTRAKERMMLFQGRT
jgi:exodeoxyribonuclease-5